MYGWGVSESVCVSVSAGVGVSAGVCVCVCGCRCVCGGVLVCFYSLQWGPSESVSEFVHTLNTQTSLNFLIPYLSVLLLWQQPVLASSPTLPVCSWHRDQLTPTAGEHRQRRCVGRTVTLC